MRGMRRIADQHDIACVPVFAGEHGKVEPRRPAKVPRVAHQLRAVEEAREQALADRDRFVCRDLIEAEAAPGRLAAFDNECRSARLEAISMRPDPAMLGFFEDKSEGVECLCRAKPDEFVGASLNCGTKNICMRCARRAVDAVARDDQIGVSESTRLCFMLEPNFHTQRAGALMASRAVPGETGSCMPICYNITLEESTIR